MGFTSFEFRSDVSLKVEVGFCCDWHGYLIAVEIPELVLHDLTIDSCYWKWRGKAQDGYVKASFMSCT